MPLNRIAAAGFAALGAAAAVPIPLAQLDFAGLVNVFNIEAGGSPRILVLLAAVGGVLTLGVLATAVLGAALAATGARLARPVLLIAAIAGFVTATPLWLPVGVVIAAAAFLTDRPGTSPSLGSSYLSAT